MKIVFYSIIIFSFITLFSVDTTHAQVESSATTDLNLLSEQFVEKVKNGEDTNAIRTQLHGMSLEDIERELNTNAQKLAFWVNIYNGYIQVILTEDPDLYNDRRSFFKKEQIPIAGRMVSFAKIEHGIIRKSQWELGLGMIRKWFPGELERKLRVDQRDYRVHFALNCGAIDCPPVAIYKADILNEQFEEGTKRYLERTSTYNSKKNEVAVTSLFNWFRGDFGFKKGVKNILKDQKIIPTTKVDIIYTDYDWTLDLDNFIDL